MATLVAARANAAPDTFADLARDYSEDIVTRDAGGSVGGISPSDVPFDSVILDALAALKVGEISRVVETGHGFHILLRRPPVPLATLAARRIVIDYAGAASPGGTASPKAKRSRGEAFTIARAVSAMLRADPTLFETLLAHFSPPEIVGQGGDIGVWTTQEPGPFEREREMLQGMRIGETSDPIDGRDGVQIFIREPVPADHHDYAVSVLKIPKSSLMQGSTSTESAAAEAHAIARTLARTPKQWDALVQEYCCIQPQRWRRGETRASKLAAVEGLAIESIAGPLDEPPYFIFVKRVEPVDALVPRVLYELPAPESFDVAQFASGVSGTIVQKRIRELADEAVAKLGLSPEVAERIRVLHARLADSFQSGGTQASRKQAIADFQVDMRSVLTADLYSRYQQFVRQTVTATVIDQF